MNVKFVTLLFSALCAMQATISVSAGLEYELGGSLASSMGSLGGSSSSSLLSSAAMSGLNTLGLSGVYPDPGLYPGMYPPTGTAYLPGGGLIRRIMYVLGEIARFALRVPIIILRILTFPLRVIICVMALFIRIALIPARLIIQGIVLLLSLICRGNALLYRY